MKTRMIRINDEITKITAEIIRKDLSDPSIGTVVSVIRSETTQDLKYCTIYVSILVSAKKESTMAALNRAIGFIRKNLAKKINLRQTPEIKFVYDDSIEHGMKMRELIEKVNRDNDGEDSRDIKEE